jgi:hypothetical protein
MTAASPNPYPVPGVVLVGFVSLVGLASSLNQTAVADLVSLANPSPTSGGRFGDAVASIGDIDGDGYNDMLVGAPLESPVGMGASGRARIFSGKTLALIRTHTSPTPTSGGNFGHAVIAFPDLNADGVQEYGVGAPGEQGQLGRFHLFSGANGSPIYSVVGTGPRTFEALSLVPDCTGDGLPEFVAGVFGNFNPLPIEVREARNGALWRTLVDPAPQQLNQYGIAVAGIDDVTGDGLGDVIVGAPRAEPPGAGSPTPENAGRGYVFNGATGALHLTLLSNIQSIDGLFGSSFAGLGDLDGDGRAEIAVGAPFETASTGGDGRVHIHSGATGAWIRTILTADPAPFSLTSGEFGAALANAGDIDGDGFDDLAIGAPEEVPSPGETGRVYLFSAKTGALIEYHDAPGATAKEFGLALDAGRDLNGDGLNDLVIGAPTTLNQAGVADGRAYALRRVPGDVCSASRPPLVVGEGEHRFTTVGAANDFPNAAVCGPAGALTSDVFFEFTANCTGRMTIATCGPRGATVDFDSTIVVYGGCTFDEDAPEWCTATNPIACSLSSPGCPLGTSTLELDVTEGSCYRIRVGGMVQGSGTLRIDCQATCLGDLDIDGVVGQADLAILLGSWGTPGPGDLDGNDQVNQADLAILLGAWGDC